MKKILSIENSRLISSKFARTALAIFFGLVLAVSFWTVTTPVAKANSSENGGDNDRDKDKDKKGTREGDKDKEKEKEKCTVCHNGKDKKIECDDVKEWLRNHPGDTRGTCEPTPVKNR